MINRLTIEASAVTWETLFHEGITIEDGKIELTEDAREAIKERCLAIHQSLPVEAKESSQSGEITAEIIEAVEDTLISKGKWKKAVGRFLLRITQIMNWGKLGKEKQKKVETHIAREKALIWSHLYLAYSETPWAEQKILTVPLIIRPGDLNMENILHSQSSRLSIYTWALSRNK